MDDQKHTGVVKWFNTQKGYGFISQDGADKDVFVHINDLGGTTIAENDKVEFELKETPKGLAAVNVTRI